MESMLSQEGFCKRSRIPLGGRTGALLVVTLRLSLKGVEETGSCLGGSGGRPIPAGEATNAVLEA